MKIIALILSFYILALAAFPCVDVHEISDFHKIELTKNTSDQHHQDSDHCSPFCTCSCCAAPIIFDDNIIQFNLFTYSEKLNSDYNSVYISTLFFNIWQPPKIS